MNSKHPEVTSNRAFWIALLAGIALFTAGALFYSHTHAPPPAAAPQTFDAWFVKHQKSCPLCGGTPDTPICMEAFERLREDLKRNRPKPTEEETPALPVDLRTVAKFGYKPNPDATRDFVATLKRPTFTQAAPAVVQNATERNAFLYRALQRVHRAKYGRDWIVGTQKIGDCVSWGWGHGADVHLAVMWALGDITIAEWRPAATEAIYGGSRVEARGRSYYAGGDGSYGGAAARWVREWGIVFRQPYPELGIDLTTYDGGRARSWGAYGCGGPGDNGRLDSLAKQHPIRNVALVRSFREAAAALQSGYPVPVCSGQGFHEIRDRDGFSRPSGSWSHCMCFVGVRFGDRPGLLCLNSWGPRWISGPKWPEDMPDGSFWVDASVCDRMLSLGDSFAISGYDGFPLRTLRHGDWARSEAAPADSVFALAP